jgi:hypothetical protein
MPTDREESQMPYKVLATYTDGSREERHCQKAKVEAFVGDLLWAGCVSKIEVIYQNRGREIKVLSFERNGTKSMPNNLGWRAQINKWRNQK